MSRSNGAESAADPQSAADPRTAAVEDRDLRVVLELERGGSCFIDDLDGEVVDFDVRVVDGNCHAEATVRESRGAAEVTNDGWHDDTEPGDDRVVPKYYTDNVCDHCPSSVFTDYGCIPQFIRAEGQSFFIKVFLPDSAMVSNLVTDLNEILSAVRLVSMTHTGSGEELSEEIYEVDFSVLTPKQREALELAIERQYYEGTEASSMASLAGELGISTSAFSQRLARAERNLMEQFVTE